MKLENDPFVGLAEKAADTFSQAASPGAWLVDLFPFCMLSSIQNDRSASLMTLQ